MTGLGERVLSRVRGLWRFDGDEEPVQVSRRTFLFLGGAVAAGAVLPAVVPSFEWRALGSIPDPMGGLNRYRLATLSGYRIERDAGIERLRLSLMGVSRPVNGEWVMTENCPEELKELVASMERKAARA